MNKQLNFGFKLQQGFSLIEMAIVMVIVGALLGGLLVSLSSTQEMNNRNSAESEIDEIMEALYGYAQATGRLPCPATATSNGAEDPVGGGNCNQPYGFVPSATLGLSGSLNGDGLLMDPWLNPYRYAVSQANGDAFTEVPTLPSAAPPAGIRGITIPSLTPDLRVCGEAACTNIVASGLPAVVLSMGADWAEFTGADADATENAEGTTAGYRHGNDVNYVSSGYIEDVFDDVVRWMSPNLLYTRMISAGQLP